MATFAEEEDDGDVGNLNKWGPLATLAFIYVAIGAWDWTDTVEALARFAPRHSRHTWQLLGTHGSGDAFVAAGCSDGVLDEIYG